MKLMTSNEIKSEMMNILKYINGICKKNKINYTLIGGSLIGAIRHNDIIPWDDDIDIGLLLDDYNKLIDAIEKDNNSNFKIIRYENNKSCYFPHTKLVSTKTYLIEKNYQEIDNMGVFVDIFQYFYLPDNLKKRKKEYNKLITLNKIIYALRKPNKNDKKFLYGFIKYIISNHVYGKKRLFSKLRKIYNKYENTSFIVSNFPQYGIDKEVQNIKCFDGFEYHAFGDMSAMIIKNYDMMLKTSFGNYMVPLAEKKRINHGLKAYWREENEKIEK